MENARAANGLARGHCAGRGAGQSVSLLAGTTKQIRVINTHTQPQKERDTDTDRDRTSGQRFGVFLNAPAGKQSCCKERGGRKTKLTIMMMTTKAAAAAAATTTTTAITTTRAANSNKRKTSNVSGKNAKINDTATK